MYFLETFKTKEIPVVSADGSKIKKIWTLSQTQYVRAPKWTK